MGRPKRYFRAGVGAVVLDADGRVLMFERSDIPGAWQFPQGGLEDDEEPAAAAWRELHEETGLTGRDLELLAAYPEPLVYELPPSARRTKTGMGQVQYWFFFRLRDKPLAVALPADGEFRQAAWMDFDEAVAQAVRFRQRIYERLRDFARALGHTRPSRGLYEE